jgi:hypothetical protein
LLAVLWAGKFWKIGVCADTDLNRAKSQNFARFAQRKNLSFFNGRFVVHQHPTLVVFV